MLRLAGRLLLPQGALCQALSSSQQLLQQTSPWMQQSRNRSDATSTPGQDLHTASTPLDNASIDILEQADSLVSVSQAATDAAVLAAKADVWFGTRSFIDLLVWSHDSLNLPWFEAIAISNMVLKLATVPLTILTQRDAPRMMAVRAQGEKLQELKRQMSQARSAAEYEAKLAEFTTAAEGFKTRNKGQLIRSLLMPLIAVGNGAVLISQFSAVSTLVTHKLPAMTYEGAAWFPDLTASDPYYALPIMCAATTLLMVRSSSFSQTAGATGGANAEMLRKGMMLSALVMVPMGGYVSASVALLWATNSVFQLLQNTLLANPAVRRGLGLPIGGVAPPAGVSWLSKMLGHSTTTTTSSSSSNAPLQGTAPTVVKYLPNKPSRRKASTPAASTKL